jgi:signal transduction histidine kinase
MWVGTYNGGLNRLDRRTRTFTRLELDHEDSPSAEKSQIWSIEHDRFGDLWIGTSAGLYRLNRETGDSVLYRSEFADSTSLAHDYVWNLHEDREGRLWVGTHDGLGLFDRDRETFVNYQHEPEDPASLSFNQITSIHEGADGRLWLGTHGGGLNLFDPERRAFTAYRVDDGLPSDVVLTVTGDSTGDLWLGTNRGLSRFSPRRKTFTNFDHDDGLQGRQFNRGAILTSRDGELLVGGINGFNLFEPGRIEVNSDPPAVVLTGFKIFNKEVRVGENEPLQRQIGEAEMITLRHDQSVVSFEFAALNYRNPGRNQYAYLLEGFDSEWVQAGTQRSATYTNLDPGSYTFRVRGSNNSGVWNERGAAIRLEILPPLWATWWFRLCALAALGGVVFAIIYLRTRTVRRHNLELQAEIVERRRAEDERSRLLDEMESKNIELERQNAQLERFAYTVSHDLKSPLVTIRGFLGLVEKDAAAGDAGRLREDIRQIGTAANTMSRLLEDVLELSRVGRIANPSQEVSLAELARHAAALVLGPEEGGAVVEIDPLMPAVVGDRVRLLEVFQNLIDNAVKFSGNQDQPRVSIGAIDRGTEVACFVRDNGIGVDPRYHEKIFSLFERLDASSEGTGIGLTLVKRIVEVHGGSVWIESEGAGLGATFWFSLPLSESTDDSAS